MTSRQTVTVETINREFTAKEIRSFIRLLPDEAQVSMSVSEDKYNFSTPKRVTKLHATWGLPPA